MVTFCSITAFASTVIRGKEQGFHVHAMSGKADSISVLPGLENYRRGLSSVRKDFFLTNRMSPGFFVLQPQQPGPAAASENMPFVLQPHQHSCQQAPRSQTEPVVTMSCCSFLFCKHLPYLLFNEITLSSNTNSICEPLSRYFSYFHRYEQIPPSLKNE